MSMIGRLKPLVNAAVGFGEGATANLLRSHCHEAKVQPTGREGQLENQSCLVQLSHIQSLADPPVTGHFMLLRSTAQDAPFGPTSIASD